VTVVSRKILVYEIKFAGRVMTIMANIAEGFERDGTGEFIQFLAVAKGSAAEVLSHAYVALDQNLIPQEDFDRLSAQTVGVGRMLAGLMSYLRRSGTKGLKFKLVQLQQN
jgi:hypothetical protein